MFAQGEFNVVLLTYYMFNLQGGVRCLQFDNDKIISGSWDMTIMVGPFSFLYS